MSWEEANEKEHPVETQWHHGMLVRHGFEPVTLSARGLVRSYEYRKGDRAVTCHTGVWGDHWTEGSERGPWSDLETHLEEKEKEACADPIT